MSPPNVHRFAGPSVNNAKYQNDNWDLLFNGNFTFDTAYDSLAQAVSDLGSDNKTLFVTRGHSLTTSQTTPANIAVEVLKGGYFDRASGVTLTISGPFSSHVPYQTAFIGSGSVVFGTACRLYGTGSPESVIAAPIGSLFLRTDGSTGTTLYVKESGTGNTGWVTTTTIAIAGLTTGTVPKASGASTLEDSIIREFTASGNLAIGINSSESPSATFYVATNASGTAVVFSRHQAVAGAPALVLMRRSRGTEAAPSNLADGDDIWQIQASPYSISGGGAGGYFASGYIKMRVDGTFTAGTGPPTAIDLATNQADLAPVVRLTIDDEGIIAASNTTDATSATAAAFKLAGGLGVAKKSYLGDDVFLSAGKGITFGAGTKLDAYEEGTFTGTLTGVDSAVTGTLIYVRVGKVVTLYIPTLTGTSNTTACTVTGMPSAIYPGRRQILVAEGIVDNGNNYIGSLDLSTAGVITLGFRSSLTAAPSDTFTNSGTKGLNIITVTYSQA